MQGPAGQSLLTVKVRHVQPDRLYPRWLGFYGRDGQTLRVEEERDRIQRVLTASFTAPGRHPARALADSHLRLTDILASRQWSFLRDCGAGPPPPEPVAAFGPILVLSWAARLDDVEASVSRWRLPVAGDGTEPALDMMEISRRSVPAEAGFLYPALAASIRRRGLDPDGGIPWLETRAARWLRDCAQPA